MLTSYYVFIIFLPPACLNKKRPYLSYNNKVYFFMGNTMNIIKRDDFFDFDKFFNGFYPPSSAKQKTNTAINPRVDIYHTENSYELIAELPGISKDNITVTVKDGILMIEASNEKEGSEKATGELLRRERHLGKFVRSFDLGQDIEQTEIKASFKNGLLMLMIPKAKEIVPETQKIEIH